MTSKVNVYAMHNWYVTAFKRWAEKFCGPKPSERELELAHVFGKPGKQSLALAMAMREGGMSGTQMMYACGGKPQNNHRRDLITAGFFKRLPASGPEGETVYKIELTAKGTKRVELAARRAADAELAGQAEPVKKPVKKAASKAKGKPVKKAGKGKGKAKTPTSDAPSVTEQAPDASQANATENAA